MLNQRFSKYGETGVAKLIKNIWLLFLKCAVEGVTKNATKAVMNESNLRSINKFGMVIILSFLIWGLFDVINLQYYKSPLFYIDIIYGVIFWPIFVISSRIVICHYKENMGIQLLFGLAYLGLVFGVLNSISYMDFWTFLRMFMAVGLIVVIIIGQYIFKAIFQGMKDGTIILPEGDPE